MLAIPRPIKGPSRNHPIGCRASAGQRAAYVLAHSRGLLQEYLGLSLRTRSRAASAETSSLQWGYFAAGPNSRAARIQRCARWWAAFFLALLPASAQAIGEIQGDYSLEAIGAVRLTGAYQRYTYDLEPEVSADDGFAGSVLRLLLQGDLGATMDYKINAYGDLARLPAALLGGAVDSVGSFRSPYRSKHLAWDFWRRGTVRGQLGLDHFYWSLHREPLDVSVGRMPINYAVTRIFSPNDFFVPFAATAINKSYKAGVDALRVNYSLGSLSAAELVAVLGSDAEGVPGWGQSAALLRASTVQWGFEGALLGGKLAQRWIAGASFQGEAGPLSLRGEGHVGFPDRNGNGTIDEDRSIHLRFSLGADLTLSWQNATIGLESMYLTDGATMAGAYPLHRQSLYPDDLPYLGALYLGLSMGAEIIPILRLNAVLLTNARDPSGLGSLMLLYSIADEAEFVGGVLIPWGRHPARQESSPTGGLEIQSEFGQVPITGYVETRFYF